MAIFHFEVKTGGRGNGKSAVASAAYRSGDKLHRDIDGKTRDFSRKQGIEHSEIFLPENAPAEYKDREKLWNAVEANEKSKDARFFREFEFALPYELTPEQQKELAQGFCRELTRQGMCVDLAIHSKNYTDEKSGRTYKMYHAHAMATTRKLDKKGEWEKTKEKKEYALDENGNRIPIIDEVTGKQKIGARGRKMWKRVTTKANEWDKKETLEGWRETWENMTNKALEKAGSKHRVSRLSNKARGINRIPQLKLGPAACAIERRKKGSSWKVAKNNQRIALNKALDKLDRDERQLKFADAKAAGRAKAAKTPAAAAGEKIGGAVTRLAKTVDRVAGSILGSTPAPSQKPVGEESTPWSMLTKTAQQEILAKHRFDEDDEEEGQGLKSNVGYIAPEEGRERTKKDEGEQSAKQQEKTAQNRYEKPQEVKDAETAIKQGADKYTLQKRMDGLLKAYDREYAILKKEADTIGNQATWKAYETNGGNMTEALKVGEAATNAEIKAPTTPIGIAANIAVTFIQGAISALDAAMKFMDESNEATQNVNEQQAGLARVLSRMEEPQGR